MAQFLDKAGLTYLWDKVKTEFALKNHTHNYAGSSSAGGSATSAVTATSSTTAAVSDNSTKIATTAWVRNYIASLDGDEVSY